MKSVSRLLLIGWIITYGLFCSASQADPYRPLDHLWYGTRDIPDQKNLIIFSVGTAATLLALNADQSAKSYFNGNNRLSGWENIGNFWGSGIPTLILGVGGVSIGLLGSRDHELNAGEALLEAFIVNGIYTQGLKMAFHRERPDGSDHLSFPSGHASTAFTTAAVAMEMYGPALGVPALALGVLAATSRMASNKHWLSDTIFGATLGYIVGRSYTQHHKSDSEKSASLTVYPYFESQSDLGLTAIYRF
jgi:membrane-associated phospholipid phosphatase